MKVENISFDEFDLRRKSLKMFLIQGYFSNAFELLDENIATLNLNIKEIQTNSKRKFKDLDSKREAKKETQISNKIDQIIMQSVRGISEALLLIQDFSNFNFASPEVKKSNIKVLDRYLQNSKQIKDDFVEGISKIMSQDLQIIENSRNLIILVNNNHNKSPQSELKEEFINAPKINEIDYLESVIDYRQVQIKLIEKTLIQIEELEKIFANQHLNENEDQNISNNQDDKSVLTIQTNNFEKPGTRKKYMTDGSFSSKTAILFMIGLLVFLILMSISK